MKPSTHLVEVPAATKGEESRVVGIADLRSFSQKLVLFTMGGRRVTATSTRRRDVEVLDWPQLVELASEEINGFGRSLGAIATVVSCADLKHPRIEPIAIHPVQVSSIPDVLAAAHAVPDSWESFQWIDSHSQLWWLIEKGREELRTARSAPFSRLTGCTRAIVEQFAAVGFANVAVSNVTPEIPNALLLDSDTLLCGAYRAWQLQTKTEGAHISLDERGRDVLTVAASHRIAYRIEHPNIPVFSPEEPALAELADHRPTLLVIDATVNALYGDSLDAYSRGRLNCAAKIVISGSEAHKSLSQVTRICREAARVNFPRHGIVVGVGGGVTLDVAGFAASMFRRGVGYLRVPTSLIGLIDAGLGIKQGVNFAKKKNLFGAFYPPLGTINDPSFLKTLPLEHISRGFAEIIKIALVRDENLFSLLEEHGRELVESRFVRPNPVSRRILLTAEMLMIEELRSNLYEIDHKRLVDFGHTFSPAIEAQTNFEVGHGDAVAIDILLSTAIAVNRGLCDGELLDRILCLYEQVNLPASRPLVSFEQLDGVLDAARLHRGGRLNLVVPLRAGRAVFLDDVKVCEIEKAWRTFQDISSPEFNNVGV
jgi:3-dehydroquinate synthetase